MNRILPSQIRRTVCTKGRLALAMTLTLVALFATVGALAQNYNGLPASNGEPKSFLTSLTSVPSMVMTKFFPQKSSQAKASISTAKKGYVPGEAVSFRAEGFRPGETVTLRITHLDGTSETSDTHNWQSIRAGEDGTFTASISMARDTFGHDFVVTAHGEWSGANASAVFSQVALIATNKSSYDQGETAALVGSYFANKEPVTIQVTDSAGNKLREPLVAYANESGQLVANWLVSPDEATGSTVLVTATGDLSGLTAQTTLAGPQAITPVALPNVPCPSNLNSCTAKDVTTTIKKVEILNNDLCENNTTDTISLRATIAYAATSNERYDLGLFVSADGGTVKEPSSALVCSGAAAQVNQGDGDAYPDADSDLFLTLDPTGHASTPSTTDTCGDLRATTGPVNWTIDAVVDCKIVNNTLKIPSCRVWEQNANHGTSCQTLQQAGTGSKCDCTDLVVTADLNPCATKVCNDENVCTTDSCTVSGTPGNLVGTCVYTPKTAGTSCGDSSSGACDAADTCDSSGVCQSNHTADGGSCGDAGGACTNQDTCLAGVCKDNGFKSATATCGSSADTACDNPDHCSGTDGSCVPNYESAGANCGDAAGACTNQDKCDGSGGCTDNGFKSATTACGSSSDTACDNPDHCSGTDGSCVPNYEPVTTNCGDAGAACTNQDKCNGSGGCTDNGFKSATTACGNPSDTACDNPDHCSGTDASCVPNQEPDGTNCGDAGTQCTNQDTCLAGGCQDNGFKPLGTTCIGTSNGAACDAPDSCNGSGTCVDAFDTPPTVTLALNLACGDPPFGPNEQGGANPTQLVATVSPNGSYSYSWTGPDGAIATNAAAITPTKPGIYTVMVTDTSTSCPNNAAFQLCFTGQQVAVASVASGQQPQATASFTVPAQSQPTGFRAYLAKLLSVFG
ncbi:MAG TPA: hypothetical protein VGW76_06770 [Pyrinomonadaceae bacterium]|nr:hypothetical protein [Pyrinomonadaceae bacterium]